MRAKLVSSESVAATGDIIRNPTKFAARTDILRWTAINRYRRIIFSRRRRDDDEIVFHLQKHMLAAYIKRLINALPTNCSTGGNQATLGWEASPAGYPPEKLNGE